VDAERVGLGLRVVVEANLAQHSEDKVRQFEQAVLAVPQIVQCHSTTGDSDYVLTVLVADIKRFEQFLHDTLLRLPGITHVRSRIVLKELKAESRLPLPLPPAPTAAHSAAQALTDRLPASGLQAVPRRLRHTGCCRRRGGEGRRHAPLDRPPRRLADRLQGG
jgi:hypothetical protein